MGSVLRSPCQMAGMQPNSGERKYKFPSAVQANETNVTGVCVQGVKPGVTVKDPLFELPASNHPSIPCAIWKQRWTHRALAKRLVLC